MAALAPREAGGAHSPEELEILLEDACIVRDGWAAAALFEHDAVLAVSGTAEARGEEEIARTSSALWAHGGVYVAVPARVVQAGDVALSIGGGISVMRRGADRCWRYAICVPASNAKGATVNDRQLAGPRVVDAQSGEILGPEDGVRDRFVLDAADAEGRFALVEHLMAPRALAAPLHRHTREDEFSFVLEGRLGALLGDHEVFADAGDLVFKPRGQWHTFWNAGDSPARILEIISPGGLEELFREFGAAGLPDPKALTAMAARYGAELDFKRTMPIVERHSLMH